MFGILGSKRVKITSLQKRKAGLASESNSDVRWAPPAESKYSCYQPIKQPDLFRQPRFL